MGGDNIPFGINTIKLSCLDCSMKDVSYCNNCRLSMDAKRGIIYLALRK